MSVSIRLMLALLLSGVLGPGGLFLAFLAQDAAFHSLWGDSALFSWFAFVFLALGITGVKILWGWAGK